MERSFSHMKAIKLWVALYDSHSLTHAIPVQCNDIACICVGLHLTTVPSRTFLSLMCSTLHHSKQPRAKTRFRSTLLDEHMEWLMLAAIEGPDQLSDEMADEVVNRFRDWPGKERYIPL